MIKFRVMSKETEAIIELMCLAANVDGVVQPIEDFVIVSKISSAFSHI